MDNLTHTLVGVTLARTPLGRAGRGATAALVLASNAPDIDIVASVGGTLRYLQWHRGPTHGPLGILGLGLVTAGLVWAGLRAFDRPRAREHASYQRLAAISIAGVLLHVLMDLPTTYGTRLLTPFDWHWYAIDLIPIIDIYLLVALATGLLVGARSSQAGRRSAAIVFAFMVANYGVRHTAHERALTLAPLVFGSLLPEPCDPSANPAPLVHRFPRRAPLPDRSRCLVEISAIPAFSTPFHWRLLAQLSDGYLSRDVQILDGQFRSPTSDPEGLWRTATQTPNRWTPPVFAAASGEVGQIFLGFSRVPAAEASSGNDGSVTVRWRDMRFVGGPAAGGGRDRVFSATVRVDADGRILEQRLGP